MKYHRFDEMDKRASVLVYGTGNSKIMGEDEGLALDCLDQAWEAGFTMFDTARLYGQAEHNFGIWMEKRGLREQVMILDKGCNPGMTGSTDELTPEVIRSQLEESLHKMRTDYTDFYLLHRDDESKPVGPIVEVLNELKEKGKIRRFGGSNWSVERVNQANIYAREHGLIGFTVASPCFNLVGMVRDPWGGSVQICGPDKAADRIWYKEQGIPVIPYSSLARGFLSGKYHTGDRIEDCLGEATRIEYDAPENVEKLRRAEILAEKKDCAVSAIALAWLMAQDLEVYPIVSPSSIKHMQDNLKSFEITFTQEEIKWLELEDV